MHTHNLSNWSHDHVFDIGNQVAERSTRLVMWITAAMMVLEITAGWWYNSMALLADGWHMSSHAVAIGLSAFAYSAARKYARDTRFAFGTWKIEILGGFASAIFLLGVAALMIISSVERIISPQPIHYQEAVIIAVPGLLREGQSAAGRGGDTESVARRIRRADASGPAAYRRHSARQAARGAGHYTQEYKGALIRWAEHDHGA